MRFVKRRRSDDGGRGRRAAGIAVLLALTALVLAGAVGSTSTSSATAAALTTGGWTIDGIVPDAGAVPFADPSGSTQELGPAQGSATKLGVINTAAPPMLAMTNPNGKADLQNVWMGIKVDAGTPWLYLAWQREASEGSAVILFEFDKNAPPAACDYAGDQASLIANCNPWANRSVGDFILVWDQQGQNIEIVKRTFTGSGFDAGSVVGSTAQVSADGLFGEAALNLAEILGPVTRCETFANVIPGTVTGNSDNADYQDTVLAAFGKQVYISSCGSLRVTKATTPATAPAGSFPFVVTQADGGPLRFGASPPTSLGDTLTKDGDFRLYADLKADTDYQLAETLSQEMLDAGWSKDSIVCSVGGTSYVVTSSGTFPVSQSAQTNCTITNSYVQPKGHVTLHKQLVQDDGGTSVPTDWTLSATRPGGGTTPPEGLSGTDGVNGDLGVGTYTLAESGPGGYDASAWSCTGLTAGSSLDGAQLTVARNASISCTITNDDVAPRLKLVKLVTNDSGGTATAADWKLSAGAGSPDDGRNFDSQTASPVFHPVFAGVVYTLAETGPSGYTAGDWSCEGGTLGTGKTTVTVPLGAEATCTITNDDRPGTLTVIKHVVNDDGGTRTAGDFTLTVIGTNPAPGSFAGSESGTQVVLGAGSYSVGEAPTSGYSTSFGANCAGTIALGESKTCTVTNNDRAAPPPPPPPPPPPVVDLAITKVDEPDPVAVGNRITYTMVVTNNTAVTATHVTLSDPMPAGVTFLSATPSQGTCTIDTSALTCDLGTIPGGGSVTIELVGRPNVVGTVTNTAVVGSTEPDANPADNTASADTKVRGPFIPPARCAKVRVRPLTLKVAKRTVVVVFVRDQRARPLPKAVVRMRGPGIAVTGKTNAKGIWRRAVKPRRPGIITVRVAGPAACIGRVGVVGVFQPPVTG